MEITKLVFEFVEKLAWPIIVLIILWLFYKEIKALLNGITKGEIFGVKFERKGLEELKTDIQKSKEALTQELNNFEVESSESAKRIVQLVKDELTKELSNIKETKVDNKIVHIPLRTKESTLLALAVNESRIENLKYNIYYDPEYRNHNFEFKFIGLYSNKEIFAIGEVKKIAYCKLENDNLIATNDFDLTELTTDEINRIKATILNTKYYGLENGHKFFLIEQYYATKFKKVSFSSMRGKRYIDLNEIDGFTLQLNTQQIASLLNDKHWE